MSKRYLEIVKVPSTRYAPARFPIVPCYFLPSDAPYRVQQELYQMLGYSKSRTHETPKQQNVSIKAILLILLCR